MRVLHVSQPTSAGVANVVLSLIRDQVARGWDVHVACPIDGYLGVSSREVGATHHRWDAVRSPGPSIAPETVAIWRVVSGVRPDTVHLHSAKAGLTGRLAVRGRVPTIYMPHGWSFSAVSGRTRGATIGWERGAARWTDLTVCVSEAELELGRSTRCLGWRSVVVPNGVDTTVWRPGDRSAARAQLGLPGTTPMAVVVGRLTTAKGQEFAIRAWQRVRESEPDAMLYLVGEGEDHAELEGIAGPGVVFVGHADPRPWLHACDLVAMPSRWEGMPLALLEAMAVGRSVVASRVPGTQETLGEGDHMVTVEEPDALAHAIVTRLRETPLRAAEERRNRIVAESSFDLRTVTARMAEHTQRLATRQPVEHSEGR